MKIAKRLFTIVAAVLIATATFAQMTDQQVIEELKRSQTMGFTQEQVLTNLASKGVTREQLERLKAEYDAGRVGQTSTVISGEERTREASATGPDQVVGVKDTQQDSPQEIYGRELFSSRNLTFQPNFNLPTPENYLLGTGDEIIVDIWGNSELTFRQKISPEGTILIPNVGPVNLNGLQIKEATAKIKKAFSRIYSNLASANPNTFIKISLGNIKSIQVNIMGEVNLPGTYTLSSFASVFHGLYSAGGVNKIGSLRDIKLYREGKEISTIDIYEYLIKGDSKGNIILRQGDLIKVEPYKRMVKIEGEVKRAMFYEMKENESLANLIEYAGGFKGEAFKKNLLVNRKGASQLKVYTVTDNNYSTFMLADADVVQIGTILDKYENRVSISGAVYRPGNFAIDVNLNTIKELIAAAEGLKGDAHMGRAILYRENPDLTITTQPIDLGKLIRAETQDFELQKNDRLYIPSTNELIDNLTITLQGEVKRPAVYTYVQNLTIADLILQGGGLLESASIAKIDVARRIKNPMSTTESTTQSEVFSFSLENGLIITGDKEFVLQPYDIVTVRRSPGYEVQQNITIKGEVLFGGNYPKTNRDERISSIIKRAGGLTSTAYREGASLSRVKDPDEQARESTTLALAQADSRDSIPIARLNLGSRYNVGIDLDKAMANPGGEDDLVLREGDIINIPTYSGVVKISGAVMYPNAVTYNKNMRIGNYIKNAGGYAFKASKSRVYVVYMNGKIAKGLTAQVEPGCEIVVPRKPERNKMSTTEVLGITTSIVSVSAMIISLLR